MPEEEEYNRHHAAEEKDNEKAGSALGRHILLLNGGPHADDCQNGDHCDEDIPPDDERPARVLERDVRVTAAKEKDGDSPVVEVSHYVGDTLVANVAQVAG